MNKIKVFQGTRSVDAPRLCDSCESGVVMRGSADSDEYVYCTKLEKRVTMRVTECNRYVDRAQVPLWAMKEIAWVLHVDARRHKIGFVSAKDWQRQNGDEEMVPSHIG